MTKTVLFVTYGGGHAAMVVPVIQALKRYPGIRTETLALTLAGPYFKNRGLPYKGFKDFIMPGDEEALSCGRRLMCNYHRPETGIEEAEAAAYLGLSYRDLVTSNGEEKAAALMAVHGRNAFHPLPTLERILERMKPDMVVTTNSPRSERAATIGANKRGLPTLSMVDLFGLLNLHKLEADYVTVMSERVVHNIQASTGIHPGQRFLITGNPAFDCAFDYRGPVDYEWRRQFFPALPQNAKALLWIDTYGHFDLQSGVARSRREEDIISDLDALAHATKQSGGYLLIRPHPSQSRDPFDAWMRTTKHSHVFFAGGYPLYPLLRASDAVAIYQSTVGCEALLMQRPVIQLNYYPGRVALPLGEWGLARLAETPDALPEIVRKTFCDEQAITLQQHVANTFPQKKAAPNIAAAIKTIVESSRYADTTPLEWESKRYSGMVAA